MHPFRVALLTGVSGAGKSHTARRLEAAGIGIGRLDYWIEDGWHRLGVGEALGVEVTEDARGVINVYSSDLWTRFLSSLSHHDRWVAYCRSRLDAIWSDTAFEGDSAPRDGGSLVVEGAHLRAVSIETGVIEALDVDPDLMGKFLVYSRADVVLRQLHEKGQRAAIPESVEALRQSIGQSAADLVPRGYVPYSSDTVVWHVARFLGLDLDLFDTLVL